MAWPTPAPTFPFVGEMEVSLDGGSVTTSVSPITCIDTVAHLILSASAFHHSIREAVLVLLPGWEH